MPRARSPNRRPPNSLLGASRAGAAAPNRKAAPSTPRSLRALKRQTRQRMEERLHRRDRQVARRLGLLPPPPPSRPRLPKPQPIAVTREQVARQARKAALHAIWDEMAESGADRLDLTPRTGPPTWDRPPRLKSLLPSPGRPPQRLKRAPATTPAENRSRLPAPPRPPRTDAERVEYDRLFEIERAKADDRIKINNAVTAFRSRLSPQQWRAGWGEGIADECVALHERLFAWRRYRSA